MDSEKDTGSTPTVDPQDSHDDATRPKHIFKKNTSAAEQRDEQQSPRGETPQTCMQNHTCDQCGKSFSSKSNRNRHKRIHTEVKSHSCGECGRKFMDRFSLTKHKALHAGVEEYQRSKGKASAQKDTLEGQGLVRDRVKPHRCDECGKAFRESEDLRKHVLIHSALECDECGNTSKTFATHRVHLFKQHGIKPYTCEQCGRDCLTFTSLQNHQQIHSEVGLFSCELCSRTYRRRASLINHQKLHTANEVHCCDHCGKTYKNKPTLTLHLRTHTGHEVCPCDRCDKVFTTYRDFQRHQIVHTSRRPHKCDTCGKSYKRKDVLILHQQRHKSDQCEEEDSSSEMLEVDECSRDQQSSTDGSPSQPCEPMVTTPSGSRVGLKKLEIRLHRIHT